MVKIIDSEISYSILVRAPPEQVYDAISTAKGLDGWFTSGAEVDTSPGGNILFRWKDWGPEHFSGEDGGPVLEAQRPNRFVFQWRPESTYYTTVEIDFEASEKGTILRLREHGYHDTPSGLKTMLNCASGWGEALALCKFYVEHGLRY
ncbi:MAG: SRPBCC domain-containing protein [Candidatus Hodarchaeota archaeon]